MPANDKSRNDVRTSLLEIRYNIINGLLLERKLRSLPAFDEFLSLSKISDIEIELDKIERLLHVAPPRT